MDHSQGVLQTRGGGALDSLSVLRCGVEVHEKDLNDVISLHRSCDRGVHPCQALGNTDPSDPHGGALALKLGGLVILYWGIFYKRHPPLLHSTSGGFLETGWW